MKLTPVYVITDSEGRAELEVEGTLEQTVDAALSTFGKHTPVIFSGDLEQMKKSDRHEDTSQERLSNPPHPKGFGEGLAMRALGPNFWSPARENQATGRTEPAVPRTYSRDEVERAYPMNEEGLRAAWDALRPHFPRKGEFSRIIRNGPRAGERLLIGDTYETPAGMSKAFLVANAKTLKAAEGIAQREEGYEGIEATLNNRIPPSLSKGLAFLPWALVKDTLDDGSLRFPQWGGVPELHKTLGVCVGSSATCRKSCLVYAGQNQAVEHNNLIKGDRLMGLLREPLAFIRMMLDSMQKHVKACKADGSVGYFRPNILSDIPWEVLFPELWSYPEFKNLSIYDYTKVEGRDTDFLGRMSAEHGADPMLDQTLRYDLTFSFSGTNAEIMESELQRGRRLALVFLRQLKSGSLKPSKSTGKVNFKAAESFNNMRFLGKKIIDGDEHDLRPLDPQGTIVGLRFKSLRGKESGSRRQQLERAGEFVIGGEDAITAQDRDGGRLGYGLPRYAEGKRVKLDIAAGGKNVKWVVEGFDDGHGNIIAAGTPLQQGVPLESLYDQG